MAQDPIPPYNIQGQLKQLLRTLFNLRPDKAPEKETIESIKAGVDFHGAKLWILILAIFVASLGLNTNSAAVIIGAMLISPLMGPIIGMGLGVGINDFELFKRSFRSYLTATLFSVMTASVYFLFTPIAEAQSELLARTSPTIYDVFIALCGGLAGIIALCSIGQRSGNVIPGVAIATALMPPLCTTGFGLATGNWLYAAGAFYLYLINTIFISLATFIGVNIMHYKKKVFVDKQREKRVKHIIAAIAVLTMLPASLLTYDLVKESVFEKKANDFINNELGFKNTQIIAREINYKAKSIKIILLGGDVTQQELNNAKKRQINYGLENSQLTIVQGNNNIDIKNLQKMLKSQDATSFGSSQQHAQLLASQQNRIAKLEKQLTPYAQTNELTAEIQSEVKTLFPETHSVSLCLGLQYPTADSLKVDTLIIALLELDKQLSYQDNEKLHNWLQAKIPSKKLKIIVEKSNETENKKIIPTKRKKK